MNRFASVITLVTIVGFSNAGAQSVQNGGSSADRAAVEAAMNRYAANVKRVMSDSVASMFATDGDMLQPGMAVLHGREAIRAFLAPFDGKAIVDELNMQANETDVFGTTAFQWGTYHQVARLGAQPPAPFDGRFAAQWRRESDGQWRLQRLMMQPAPASPKS